MTGSPAGWRQIDPRSVLVGSLPHVVTVWLSVFVIRDSLSLAEALVREYLYPAAAVLTVGWVLRETVRWATTSYCVEEQTLCFRTGWLFRSRMAVDRQKVRAVVLRSGPLARPLGLTRVSVGTAESGVDDSVELSWVPTATAQRLRAELLDHARPVCGEPGVLARGRTIWAVWAPFTALTLSLWAGTYAVGYQLFVAYFSWVRTLRWLLTDRANVRTAVRVLVVVPAVVGVVGSVLAYLACWWRFTLERTAHGTLEARYGLLVVRSTSLQESRVRGVEFVQPLLPRLLHRARLLAVTTGAGSQATLAKRLPQAGRRTLLPLGPAAEAGRAAGAVLGRDLDLADLLGHPVQARYKRYRWAVVITATVLLVAWLPFRGLLQDRLWTVAVVGISLLVAALLVADDNYRALGHRLEPDLMLIRSGTVRRTTAVVQRQTVVGWVFRQSWFQYRLGLVTTIASTAAGQGRYALHDVGSGEAVRFAHEVTPELIRPLLSPPAGCAESWLRDRAATTRDDRAA